MIDRNELFPNISEHTCVPQVAVPMTLLPIKDILPWRGGKNMYFVFGCLYFEDKTWQKLFTLVAVIARNQVQLTMEFRRVNLKQRNQTGP